MEVTYTGYKCNICKSTGTKPGVLIFDKCPFCESTDIETFDSNTDKDFFISKGEGVCELEGPYECPLCGGHIMLDATYLDQVETRIRCPYCEKFVYVKEV